MAVICARTPLALSSSLDAISSTVRGPLRLNEVVEKNVDPTTALKVGLKVDADVLPAGILEKVDLKSPTTTVALLKMNAVVGL
jgi:hypothetical protein